MPLPDWSSRPTIVDSIPRNIKHALFIDEYGETSFKHVDYCLRNRIIPDNEKRYFGLCGSIFHMDDHQLILEKVKTLKERHWPPDGKHLLAMKNSEIPCRVCFHSTEIKSHKGAFSKNVICHQTLSADIGKIISSANFKLVACVVDKYKYAKQYGPKETRKPPYSVAAEFMLERFVYDVKGDSKAIVVLESRGKKEDGEVLKHLKEIIKHGNYYLGKNSFSKIAGVYFNPKRTCDNQKSYVGLEISDLCCSTLIRAAINENKMRENRAYLSLRSKIRGYPNNIVGRGIKLIP